MTTVKISITFKSYHKYVKLLICSNCLLLSLTCQFLSAVVFQSCMLWVRSGMEICNSKLLRCGSSKEPMLILFSSLYCHSVILWSSGGGLVYYMAQTCHWSHKQMVHVDNGWYASFIPYYHNFSLPVSTFAVAVDNSVMEHLSYSAANRVNEFVIFSIVLQM